MLKGQIYLPAGVLIRPVFSYSHKRFHNIAVNGKVAEDSEAIQAVGFTNRLVFRLRGENNRPGIRILVCLRVCLCGCMICSLTQGCTKSVELPAIIYSKTFKSLQRVVVTTSTGRTRLINGNKSDIFASNNHLFRSKLKFDVTFLLVSFRPSPFYRHT